MCRSVTPTRFCHNLQAEHHPSSRASLVYHTLAVTLPYTPWRRSRYRSAQHWSSPRIPASWQPCGVSANGQHGSRYQKTLHNTAWGWRTPRRAGQSRTSWGQQLKQITSCNELRVTTAVEFTERTRICDGLRQQVLLGLPVSQYNGRCWLYDVD